jgi:hypothetical protein
MQIVTGFLFAFEDSSIRYITKVKEKGQSISAPPTHLEHLWNSEGPRDVLYSDEEHIYAMTGVGTRLNAIFPGFIDHIQKSPVWKPPRRRA